MRLVVALLGLCLSFNAFAWWNEEWTQRKQVTINTTVTGANTQAALKDVPVLLRLHAGNFPRFLELSDAGKDFRVIDADDATPLRFHVERFDAVAEMAFIWVKAPNIGPATDQGSLFLYFGNEAAPVAEDRGASFDVNTAAAFHFGETAGLPADSTAYGTTVASGQVLPVPASLIGGGAALSGTEALVLAAAPQLALDPATGWTFETWIRLAELPAEPAYVFDMKGSEGAQLSLQIREGQAVAQFGGSEVIADAALSPATWHHLALAVGPDGMRLFLDGRQAGATELAQVAPMAIAAPVHIGGSAGGSGLLVAELDELRISNVARSADWIAFNAKVQGSGHDQVLGYDLDMSGADGEQKAGNFGIIFQNVFGKPDAWVEQSVIIICGLMMLAAAGIMFLKSVALSRAAAASRKFLLAYGALGQKQEDDLGSLNGERQKFRDSPLWQVYHVGINEIQKRMSPAVGAGFAGLEARSLAAVRAAMDAMMVRESQRLNSQLVLLTIAISGGPFIGLFGTVVGVMVTFAAIAATGDVNIAAIAPGMAAALLATMAGLGVAIPALFGYNWLGSRAKDQVADMRVFADELEARFNERYGA
jgi:biopolymer transport protein ExbB